MSRTITIGIQNKAGKFVNFVSRVPSHFQDGSPSTVTYNNYRYEIQWYDSKDKTSGFIIESQPLLTKRQKQARDRLFPETKPPDPLATAKRVLKRLRENYAFVSLSLEMMDKAQKDELLRDIDHAIQNKET